jgi:hypothetical protein
MIRLLQNVLMELLSCELVLPRHLRHSQGVGLFFELYVVVGGDGIEWFRKFFYFEEHSKLKVG